MKRLWIGLVAVLFALCLSPGCDDFNLDDLRDCTVGSSQCHGNILQKCGADGVWATLRDCGADSLDCAEDAMQCNPDKACCL